ncbi:MAG: hotdog fold domain-containing protein [Oleiphilaceae bacterium]|nr:hotdog fold domain-containing protein [Oleiphilaceae bacterium]
MSQVLSAFEQFGAEQFSKMVCQMAPYFSTINPVFVELKPGYSEARIPKVREIENHIGTVHAIAMCNAAELVGGTLTDATLPEGMRWIPKGMTVQYLAKAKTDLRAVATAEGVDFTEAGDKVVAVDIFDTAGTRVFHADITMDVRPK